MAIKRIDPGNMGEALIGAPAVIVPRKAPEPAGPPSTRAEQEANRAAARVIALEREVGLLKDKMQLAKAHLEQTDGQVDLVYLLELLDPAKPLPQPVMTIKEPTE